MKKVSAKARLAAIFFFFALAGSAVAAPEPPLGRFVGVLRHEGIKRDQLAKLDFIASREEGNVLRLMAVLTLHFGDFASGEYVAYHFDDVRFNLLTQEFVFDQSDQGITLVAKQYSGKEFTGEFRSSFSGDIGKVILRKDAPAEPKLPLIEPVWGEYRGKCTSNVTGTKVDTTVQLYTYRSTEGATQVGNPFRAYKIKGFLGEQRGQSCLSGSTGSCVWGNMRSGSYNFYKNRLVLFNNYRNLSCTTEPDGLACGGCDFLKRVSGETNQRRALTPPTSVSVLGEVATNDKPALEGDIASIQGEYHGYLHHEYLDRYQQGSLNILTYQASSATGQPVTLRMSAIAALHFANEEGTETISYKFKERSYPNPLLSPQFLFIQPDPERDVDAVLQVTSLGNGMVKGVWYSQLFGRVGTFVFYKQGLPQLPSTSKTMEALSAHYQSTDWEMDLLVGMGTTAPNTENPFAPLTFGGWILMPSVTPKIHITGGSYDFYTGRLGLEVGENIVQLGQRVSRNKLFLKKMYYAVLAPLPPHALEPYRLVGAAENKD